MSESQTAKISSLDSKIKDISDYLKSSVLTPAEKEKEDILAKARDESVKIVQDAEKQAADIIAKARKEAESVKQTTDSALKIAAKQTVDRLKLALEKETLAFTAGSAVKNVMNSETVIKEFITEVIRQYSDKGSFSIVLGDTMKNKLASFAADQIRQQGASGIRLSDEGLASGFAVVFDNGVLRYDFTEESVTELLTEFIRPEIRKALFPK